MGGLIVNAQSEKPHNPRSPQPSQSENNQTKDSNKTPSIIAESPQNTSNPKTETTDNPRSNDNWTKFLPNRWTDWLLVLFTGLLALFTYFLWDSTSKLWKSSEQQISIARDAANAAQKSATVAEQTLISTQRPWITVNMQITKGLVFDERGATIEITFIEKNVGKSPAVGIDFRPKIICLYKEGDWIIEQKKILDTLITEESIKGYTLFPGDHTVMHSAFTLSWDDIKKYALDGKIITPFLFGIVYYRFTYDSSIHKTAFVNLIGKVNDRDVNAIQAISIDEGNIPIEKLILVNIPSGNYAD
jgi:hypothetical protein